MTQHIAGNDSVVTSTDRAAPARPARTVLEQRIRERRQTFEEFAECAERFAQDHGEPGTLSLRHLQRLVAGQRSDGRPLGQVRPATARLLERIFGESIFALLAAPSTADSDGLQTVRALRVAVAVVIKGAEVLLVHRREDPDGLSWQFPAGVVKPGTVSSHVAVRETLLETGVHCVVARMLGSRIHPLTNVLCDYLLCDYVAGEVTNSDPAENSAATWVGIIGLARLIPAEHIYPPVVDSLVSLTR